MNKSSYKNSKITIITPYFPNIVNKHSGIFVYDQAIELAKKINEVHVWVTRPIFKISRKHPFIRLNSKEETLIKPSLTNVTVSKIHYFPFPKDSWLYHISIGISIYLKKKSFHKILLVHTIFPLGAASCFAGLKFNLITHGSDLRYFIQNRFQKKIIIKTLKKAKNVIAVSEGLSKDVIILDPKINVQVIHNGLNFPKKKLFLRENAENSVFKFIFVGALIKQKGVYELLSAFKNLQIEHNIELHIIGEGIEKNNLQNLVNPLIDQNVYFYGSKENGFVSSLMSQTDCLVLPSYKEGFGRVIIEMFKEGNPVISTYSGGPEYIINPKNGLLVEPKNAAKLLEAMEYMIVNYNKFNGIQIFEDAKEKYNNEKLMNTLILLLNE